MLLHGRFFLGQDLLSPQATTMICVLGQSGYSVSTASIASNASNPDRTSPKTTFFPSNSGRDRKVTMNLELLLLGPWFTIESKPRLWCRSWKPSSENVGPWMDSPPVPLNLVISPPSTRLRGMTLCTTLLRKLNGRPFVPARSPVQRQRKFSAVRGTVSLYRAIFSRYIGPFPDTEWLKYAKIIKYIFREVNLLGIWTNKSKKKTS